MEPYVYTPTEPIPVEAGSPLTYEQGERIVQALEGLKVDIASNQEINNQALSNVQLLLDSIKTNTVPKSIDTVTNPSGVAMTFEQGQAILESLHNIMDLGLYVGGAVMVWFVVKWLYRFIGGTLFGGV